MFNSCVWIKGVEPLFPQPGTHCVWTRDFPCLCLLKVDKKLKSIEVDEMLMSIEVEVEVNVEVDFLVCVY